MKKKYKLSLRLAGILLTVLLMVGIVGCAQSATTAGPTTKASGATTTQAATEGTREHVEISWMGNNMGEYVEGTKSELLIEQKLGNVDLKPKSVQLDNKEAMDLMFATGDMPDCGFMWRDPYVMYYDQELTRTIPIDLVAQYAPSYYKLITVDVPFIEKVNIPTDGDDTVRLGLAGYDSSVGYTMYYFTTYYRYDWLQKFGIEPESEVIKLTDRLYFSEKGLSLTNLYKFLQMSVNDDPDNNGQKDTIGVSGWKGISTWRPLLAAFGLQEGSVNDNGKAAMYYATDAYKSFLKYANMLYSEGLVDKEALTMDDAQAYEKYKLAKYAYNGWCTYNSLSAGLLASGVAAERPPMSTYENDPTYIMLISGSDVGDTKYGVDGQFGTKCYGYYPTYNNFIVNKNVDDEKLIDILRFFEIYNFDQEAVMASTWGVEGETFTYDEDGMPVFIKDVDMKPYGTGGCFAQYVQNDDFVARYLKKGLANVAYSYFVGKDSIMCNALWVAYKDDRFNKTQLSQMATDGVYNLENIGKVVSEFRDNCISGELQIDAAWDQYISDLNANGYDKYIAELDKADVVLDIIGKNDRYK